MIGQVLNGNYRLTDLVGSGGYADVYLARDLRTNTIVAVKILHSHVARDPDVAARFEREAMLARSLQTPHVARVLDAGQDPPSPPFMVMEFVQGLTVAELIRRHGPFPIREALRIADQLLDALGSAHALGIVHRDIKPQNLMLDAEGRLKVLDFGVARVAGTGSMTALGHLLGTPEYMAAEQVEGRPVDHRTDLYAAGAVLYQLLTGRPPYFRDASTDLWDLIRRVRTEQPPPLRQLRPEVSPALAAVVERAMAKDSARRFQSAYEMRQALAVAGGTDPPTSQPPPAVSAPPGATQILSGPPPGLVPPRPVSSGSPGPSPAGQYRHGPASPWQRPAGQYPPGPHAPRPGPPQGIAPSPPVPPGPGYGQGHGYGQGSGTDRKGMPAWQIAGIAVGALALLVVGVALGRSMPLAGQSTPTPLAAATAMPTRAATATSRIVMDATPGAARAAPTAPPTSSPAVQVAIKPTAPPKPTSAPPSPTVPPKPTAPPNPPGVLLADNFESQEAGKLPRSSSRPDDYVFKYDAGEYVIAKVNAALPVAPMVFLSGTYDNSVIAVDMRLMGNVASRYAFAVCRDQSTGGQAKQYRATVVPAERRLILSRWDDGTQRVLAEVRDEPAINNGTARNRLELSCAGARITAAVNGTVVASADDLSLSRGSHGIGAGTFSGVEAALEARFDNLEVREP